MKAKTTLHFYAKSTKANATGLFPIYVRLTVEGKRFEYSSKKFIEPSKWSNELSRMKGNSEEARSINSLLDFTKNQINEIQFELLKDNITLNIEEFKNRLLGTKIRERMLIPIFKEHNSKIKELLGIEYAPGTLERYETSLKHTSNFLFWKYNITDINIDKIDHAFITDYEFYLRTVRKCANNTAVKYIKNFNKIIKLCLANDWLDKNPFANYKSKVKEVERVYLSEEEIQSIINKDFKTERLSLVRDIFLFSCFTGLAYIDVKNLTKSHISFGIDGEKWVFTHRQKTETASKLSISTRFLYEEAKQNKTNNPTQVCLESLVRTTLLFEENCQNYDQSILMDVSTITENIKTAFVKIKNLPELENYSCLKYADVGEKIKLEVNNARTVTNTNALHAGTGLSQSYTGNGVVIGIIDGGFDYTHSNFKDINGTLRISRVWERSNTSGNPPSTLGFNYGSEFVGSTAILSKQYDMNTISHGTHVAGIATGTGTGNLALLKGMAPNSEIVLVSGVENGYIDAVNYIKN